MSLTTLIASKEGNYAPCLLAVFQFADGTFLRASTHNLNSAEGGNQYQSNDYLARIDEQDIAQIQARSEQGIDRIPEVTTHLFDADFVMSAYEMASGKGFKGAILKLVLVLMDVDPATGLYTFSTDATPKVKFSGICDAANADSGGMLSIRATTSHNTAKVDFPILHVQQRCVNVFPRNAFERLAGATDISSWQWGCGYDPDQAGTDPEIGGDCRRGNTTTAGATDAQGRVIADGAGIFISCDYTKANCVARGMYTADSSSRATGRFTAIQWAPRLQQQQSVSYAQGKAITVFSSRNDSIYARSYPMLYGSQWIKQPIIANVLGDGNSTRFEVVICVGDIGAAGISQVVVNGVIVPTLGSSGVSVVLGGKGPDPLFRWNFLDQKTLTSQHTGSRNGAVNIDLGWNGGGDPYGGLATIEIVMYAEAAQSNSVPNVRVLATGPKLAVYSPGFTLARSNNPAWVIYDLLVWANYSYAELDTASFIAAAAICDVNVTYLDLTGTSRTHHRFIAELVVEDRRKANEVIQALLRSFNAQLVPNSDTGLLQLFVRGGLADQQPSPVAGSNYNTGIASYLATDTSTPTGTGYPAYLIDESVIQQDGAGNPRMRGPYCTPNAQAANRITIAFQDSDNHYADDSISVADTDDVARSSGYQLGGQIVDGNISVLGISNFDQGMRISNTILAETLRGNEIGDTRGTRFFDIETTHRLEHLRVGHLVLFSYQPLGLSLRLFRVEAIKPSTNYQRMNITLRWHEDIWYTDAYGQHPAPLYSDPNKSLPNRPPYPWHPYGQAPIAGDSLVAGTDLGFAVAQSYSTAADGSQIATLAIGGNPPMNKPGDTQPPLVGMQGTTANTGGTIAGGQRIHGAIAIQDSSGKYSLLSRVFFIDIPVGTNTNTITTPTIYWQPGTVNWVLFAGPDELRWSEQANGSGTPGTITITGLNVASYGPPDILADSLVVRVKRVIHGGVWGDVCAAIASNGDGTGTITFATATTNDQFAGYDLSKLANPQGSAANVPFANFHVFGNTGGIYHVSPDPTGVSVAVGDVFVMRTNPSTFTATTLGDANFVSAYAASGLTASAEVGRRIRILFGTGRGQERGIIANTSTVITVDSPWDTTPDATSRFIIEEPTWQVEPTAKQSASGLTASPAPTVAAFSVDNYKTQTLLIQTLVADQNGFTSIESYSPLREIYLWGKAGSGAAVSDGYFTVTPSGGNVTIDLANGLNQRLVLGASAVTILAPIFTGGSIVPGSWFSLYIDQDGTGGRAAPTYTSGAAAFAADDGLSQVDGTPSVRTIQQFTFHGSVWGLDSFRMGIATA